ncbi:MAG: YciI family protein [Chloroflexota bacterium]
MQQNGANTINRTAEANTVINPIVTERKGVYYVVFCITSYATFADAYAAAPDTIAAHVARSKGLHEQGTLLMAGAFLDNPHEPLSTMAVLTGHEAAENYIKGDPFVLNGTVAKWYIREWANIFA